MTCRLLQIDNAALENLRARAEACPVTPDRFARMAAGEEGPIGNDPAYCLELQGGLRVVLSLEEQPTGRVRHASFSVFPRGPGELPSIVMVETMLPLLGFRKPLKESTNVWVEDGVAVNVIQLET